MAKQEENMIVCTEITTFLWGHQIIDDQGAHKPDGGEDCILAQEDDDHHKKLKSEGKKDHDDQSDVKEDKMDHKMEIFHEAAIGKGLSGAQRLLQERGMIEKPTDHQETSTQLKDARLRGVYENKEIRIARLDEFGREMSLKEAFREFSHEFHGKQPGKKRQEKRLKQYREELKMKQQPEVKIEDDYNDQSSTNTKEDKELQLVKDYQKKGKGVGIKSGRDYCHEASAKLLELAQLKDAHPRRVYENKKICIDKLDEFGCHMTPKEAFREFSYKFHAKRPGKKRQERRLKQYPQELEINKKMMNPGGPQSSVEQMKKILDP